MQERTGEGRCLEAQGSKESFIQMGKMQPMCSIQKT